MIRPAFTILDVIIAMTVIAVAIVAIMFSLSGHTQMIGTTSQITEAIHLANNVHEFALSLPLLAGPGSSYTTTQTDPGNFNNVCNLDGWNSGSTGPINSTGERISSLKGWTQTCRVKAFNLSSPKTLLDPSDSQTTNTNLRLLTVTVMFQNGPIYTSRWILAPTIQN